MKDIDGEADQRAVVERGLGDEEVGQVPGAEERVVQEDRVARTERLDRMRRERVLHRERHRPHVARRIRALSHHAPLRVEDRDREVLAFARLLGVRGLVHGRPDLDGDRLERAPDDPERDGIDPTHAGRVSARRFAYASTVAVTPGGSTVVDSRSSTIAGPVSDMPAPSV